jgi:glycosyltransferase involved in cell wall biosynthesis
LEVVLPELPPAYEVILVDGHSVDDTVAVARRLLPEIVVVEQTRWGKGNALACGFAVATGDIIVMFDADGSADPQEIPAFVAALVEEADVAKGSRYARGGGSTDLTMIRSLGNRVLNALANTAFGTSHTDLCYGYNAFWATVLPVLNLPAVDLPARHPPGGRKDQGMVWGDGFEIETLIACRVAAAGLRVREVPSVERDRIHGESNLHAVRDGLRVLSTIAAERRRASTRRTGATTPAPVTLASGMSSVSVTEWAPS